MDPEVVAMNLIEAKQWYFDRFGVDINDVAFIDNLDCPPPPANPCYELLPDSRPRIWYLSQALIRLSIADEVVFFREWVKSSGCHIERKICHEYDIPCYDMDNII